MERRPGQYLQPREERTHPRHRQRGPDTFFGLDVEWMSAKAQVIAGLAVIVTVGVATALLLTLGPFAWWLILVFVWAVFPAFGLLLRGVVKLSHGAGTGQPVGNVKERELLGALREYGESTAARAAMETSLTVPEADEMLEGLAGGGHPGVRVRGGGLFYASWESEGGRSGDRGEGLVRSYGSCVRGIFPSQGRVGG